MQRTPTNSKIINGRSQTKIKTEENKDIALRSDGGELGGGRTATERNVKQTEKIDRKSFNETNERKGGENRGEASKETDGTTRGSVAHASPSSSLSMCML